MGFPILLRQHLYIEPGPCALAMELPQSWAKPLISRVVYEFIIQILCQFILLPEASFGLRVLSLPASVCMPVCLSVCPSVCLSVRPSVCLSVCLYVNHLLVRAVTRDPFKLGSPNFDQRCKRPWLRALLVCGLIDLDLQGQILLESPNLPHYDLVRTITHHPFKLGSPNLDQRCKIPWLRSLLFCGAIDLDLQGQIWLKK